MIDCINKTINAFKKSDSSSNLAQCSINKIHAAHVTKIIKNTLKICSFNDVFHFHLIIKRLCTYKVRLYTILIVALSF